MNPKAEELKACPVCKGAVEISSPALSSPPYITCDPCALTVHGGTRSMLIQKWNALPRHTPEHEELKRALTTIALNAKMVPDPTMNNATDAYLVPLDDIESARKLLGP